MARVAGVLTGVAFVLNLFEGLVGCAVELELKDIDKILCLDDAIHPAFALALLGVDHVCAGEAEDEVEHRVEIPLGVGCGFRPADCVWYAGEEGRKAGAELFEVANFQRVHCVFDPSPRLTFRFEITPRYDVEKTAAHLVIRVTKKECAVFRVEVLDC